MGMIELAARRYSVRAYTRQPVEPEKLERILRTGALAPTAANRQAFRIHILATEQYREALNEVYGRAWFVQAPLVMGVTRLLGQSWARADGVDFGAFDCAIVMDHMTLAATDEGLGTCWVANFSVDAARQALDLPPEEEPVIFSPLGYPADTRPAKKRKNVSEIVRYHGVKP